MKSLLVILSVASLFTVAQLEAQASDSNTEQSYLNRSPIYDFGEQDLTNVDTIPGFTTKHHPLKISGTIYESDGVTPAKDVILYIEQADEDGSFIVLEDNQKEYLKHRGWIKTDADGTYAFYTFVPGNDRRYNQMKQLFPVIKAPSKSEYVMSSFLFDDDPLLSKNCRKKLAKKDDPTRILKTTMVDGVQVVQKDIILKEDASSSK